ncbi:hypothetical protein QCA50_008470 [Cerrena zonata]|uniref:Uncharacterized protein n=1 Tax=Cerrena zonata TaxID=2478898 RepID=A0AAW0GAF1_9APHY
MLDHIIDYLYDDHLSLLACALAARPFLASSQSHLFHTFHLARKGDQEYAHYKLFCQENPHLTCYIRSLSIVGTPETKIRYHPIDNPTGRFCACVLSDILSHFPRIENLTLDGIHLECMPSCETTVNPSLRPIKLKSLDLLHIYHYPVDGVPQFIRLLGLFSQLPMVHIACLSLGCTIPLEATVTKEVAKLPLHWEPRIEGLTIAWVNAEDAEFLSHFLVISGSSSTLRRLRIILPLWGDCESFMAVIRASKNLTHFYFDAAHKIGIDVSTIAEEGPLTEDVDVNPAWWRRFGLVSCVSIVTFVVSVILLETSDLYTIEPNVLAFQYMLDQISEGPRNIKTLTIYVRLVADTSYVDIISMGYDWDRLASLVRSTKTFPNLEIVNLILFAEDNTFGDEAAECLRVVYTALHTVGESNTQRKQIFELSCQQGDYDAFTNSN